MGFMAGVWRMLGAEDDEPAQAQQIVEYPLPEPRQAAPPAPLALSERAPANPTTIYVAQPQLDEAGEPLYSLKEYASYLLTEQALVLDINDIAAADQGHATRIVDYLSGTAEAVGGSVFEVTSNIFIFAPSKVELAGDPLPQVEVN